MRPSRGRSFAYALIALALGAAAWVIGVGSLIGQQAEAAVLAAATLSYSPPAPLGLVTTPAAIAATMLIALMAWLVHGISRGLTVLFAVGISVVASQLLKQDVLVRPELFEFDAQNTFPSGHMTLFVALSGALVWAVPVAVKAFAVLFGVVISSTISFQLLEHSWHRPSDIVGALALTLLVFSLVSFFFPLKSKRKNTRAPGSDSFGNRMLSFAVLCASAVVLVLGVILTLIAGWSSSEQLLLNGAQFALVGMTGLTLRAFQALSP